MSNVSGIWNRLSQFVAPLSSSVSSSCRNSSTEYVNALGERIPWAVEMFDASAKPPSGLLQGNIHSLGTFEECLKLKSLRNISAQFCVALWNLHSKNTTSPVEEMLATKGAYWSVCLPSACSSSEVKTGLDEWMKHLNVEASRVDCQDSILPMDAVDWFAVFMLVLLGLCVLVCTGYDFYLSIKHPEYDRKSKDDFRTSFSVFNNGYYLLKKASDREILSLYGVRFLSIVWILFGHVIFVVSGVPSVNYLQVSKATSSWTSMPIISATLAVDTFLMVSGLLVANKFLKMVPRETSLKKVSLSTIPIIAHRYLRIAPPVAILILLQVSLWRHAGSGPIWATSNSYLIEFCNENWFWALLFVQNYVSGNRMCFGHSWYLNVDMQLFILSPLIITPLLYWRERICMLMFGCLIFGGFLISFIINYVFEFPPGLMAGDPTKWAAKNQYYYVVTHTRFAPYIIGIAVGYLIHKHKDTEVVFPIFKKNGPAVFWTLAVVALVYSIFGVLPFQSPDYVYQRFTASVFIAAVPIIWTLGVGWFVLACELKQWPFLARFLGTSHFHALARLTYCIYLVHLPIMSMRASARRVPIYLSTTDMSVDFFGDCALSMLFAVFVYMAVEGPFTKFGYIVSNRLFQRFGGPPTTTSGEGDMSGAVISGVSASVQNEGVTVTDSTIDSAVAGPSTSLAEVVVHAEAGGYPAKKSSAEKSPVKTLLKKSPSKESQEEMSLAVEPSAEKAATGEPSAEKAATGEPPAEKAATGEPPAEKAATGEPSAEKAATGEPSAEKAATGEPPAEKAATGEPSAEKAATGEPSAEKAATGEPSAEKAATVEPPVDKSSTEEPVSEKSPDNESQSEDTSVEKSSTQKSPAEKSPKKEQIQ